MALTSIDHATIPTQIPPVTMTSFLIDASGEMVAFVLRASKAGDIRKVHIRLGTVTTGQTLRVSLQNVDAATGDPDGTADQSGTVSVADSDDNTWKTVTLSTDRTVARNDLYAVVVEFDSTIGNLNINTGSALIFGTAYADHKTGGTWGKQSRSPIVAIEYSDGSFDVQPGAGIVRSIKSAQQQYNYMRTMQTETIALAPRAPYIAAEGQLEGHEDQWQQANTRNFAVLQYKPKALNGALLPAPQRQQFEPAIQATTLAVGQAYEDLKRGSGIHDASLGARSNETSGRAIIAREEQGDTANFHFQDNLTTSITHEMRMIVALMRVIYDRPGRIARIIGEEGEEKTVTLNQLHTVKGEEKIFDIRTGRYDVAVTVGPSYSTKRQMQGEILMQLTKAYPELMQVAGDLMVKALDMPGAREISERLKKMLPPQLQEQDDKEVQIPPQAQAQLQQQAAEIEQLVAALEDATDQIKNKKIEAESREKIVALQEETKRVLKLAELDATDGLAVLKLEIAQIQEEIAASRADAAQDKQQAHEAGQAEAARQAAAEQQAQAAAQQAGAGV